VEASLVCFPSSVFRCRCRCSIENQGPIAEAMAEREKGLACSSWRLRLAVCGSGLIEGMPRGVDALAGENRTGIGIS